MRRQYPIILFIFLCPVASAQSWSVNPFEHKVFIENKGQFDFNGIEEKNQSDSKIQYAIVNEGMEIYFSSSGVTYKHDTFVPLSEEEIETLEKETSSREANREEEFEKGKKLKRISHYVHLNWLNASADVKMIAQDAATYYFTYGDLPGIKANAYQKIIYKNLYPYIDLEYSFPEDRPGIKYSFILHPGANVSSIKMNYSGSDGLYTDEEGNINIRTPFGDITDHAPLSFYENGEK